LNTLAGVAREKGALYRNIRAGGAIAVNLDDPWVKRLGARFKGRKITYGKRGHVRARFWRARDARGQEVTLQAGRKRCRARLNYLGRHNIANALGAAALALGAGTDLAAVRRGLAKVRPFSMRMQIENWRGVGIINDTYNANPDSMNAALETLAEMKCRGDKIAVLGDMFELGKHSAKEHRWLGQRVAKAGINALYFLGDRAVEVRKGALRGGLREEQIVIGRDHADMARRLRDRVKRGDWLLFKGSRGMRMENILHELKGGKA